MKRNFLFVCNFKMNSVKKSLYKKVLGTNKYNNIVLCPNFCDIKEYASLKSSNGVMLGAQNVSEFENGAHTGEISATMLKSAGVNFCIVGHSERKENNFETSSQINLKIKKLIDCGITPIVCVGESTYKNEEYATKFVLLELNEILQDIDLSKVIIAYEPIWAIGSGKVASVSHIQFVISAIKKYTGIQFVLYGGSFNLSNYKDIVAIDCVDGALIGGASLKPDILMQMVNAIQV